MATFQIETYTVSMGARAADSAQPRISMVSPDLSHGIRNRIVINFEQLPAAWRDHNAVGIASNVGGLNFNGISIYVYMSASMFDDIYTIARTESPLFVHWFYKDLPSNPSSTTKFVTSFRIATDDEVPGEGDTDSDLATAMLAVAGLTAESSSG